MYGMLSVIKIKQQQQHHHHHEQVLLFSLSVATVSWPLVTRFGLLARNGFFFIFFIHL